MSNEPIPAVRVKPGEYFLAAEHVEVGLQFRYGDAVYEVMSEPKRWGAAWTATIRQIEGRRPGIEFRAILHLGRKVDG
ncbi:MULTISPECIES: hypothetical protein [Kribbella]|uniref:hypothetical protein n=1 Tax=Kribbella TaxID=182639 RepID=UPI001049744A|nr:MULTISPECIES: hypothetical protein [Kribbella]